MDTSTLLGLIVYLGSPAAMNWLLSNVLEHWDKFTALDAITKKVVMFVVALLLALGSAYAVQNVSPDFWDKAQPIYAIVYATFISFVIGDAQHQSYLARSDRKAIRKAQIAIARGERG